MHPTSTSLVTASLQTTSKNYILRTTSMEKATISSFLSPAISLNGSSNLPPKIRFTAGVGAGIGITVIIITVILLSLNRYQCHSTLQEDEEWSKEFY